jgi:hypothetical protein
MGLSWGKGGTMGRIFTLDEARALMPQVKAVTEPVYTLAASLAEELSQAEDAQDEARAEALRDRLQALVQSWQQSMQDMEAEVKGLWLVDFDSGDSTLTFDLGKFLQEGVEGYWFSKKIGC